MATYWMTSETSFLHVSSVENGFEESAIDAFAALLLRLMKYNSGRQHLIRYRKEISFVMAGHRVDAKTDVCVIEDGRFILLVQEGRAGFLSACRTGLSDDFTAEDIERPGNRRFSSEQRES